MFINANICRNPGYLITVPNRWIDNRPETVCINLYNATEPILVNVTVSPKSSYAYRQYHHAPVVNQEILVHQSVVITSHGKGI